MNWIDIVRGELRKCTDCGLCLASCPTFTVSRAEGDSPRGRVHLLDRALFEGSAEPVSAGYLSGCIECGACHVPCPTGVQVATARRAHRLASEVLDWEDFERRVVQLTDLIDADAGARLTIGAIKDSGSAATAEPERGSEGNTGVLLLFGPLLRCASPHVVTALESRQSRAYGSIEDPVLVAALERASGLFADVGLGTEHERAVSAAADLLAARGYRQLTIAVLDWQLLRLRDAGFPGDVRIIPAHQAFKIPIPPTDDAAVWDHPREIPGGLPHCDVLPAEYDPASAPVLLSSPALRVLNDLVKAKRQWIAGRTLLTMDARSLARFPGARHIAEFLLQEFTAVGDK